MSPTATNIDPVEVVAFAIESLPDDFDDWTAEHFRTVTAVAQGIGVHVESIHAATDRLARLVVDGAIAPEIARADLDWLAALGRRCAHANAVTRTYLDAAAEARGIDRDRPAAGVTTNTPRKED